MKNLIAVSLFTLAIATGGALAQSPGTGASGTNSRPTPSETAKSSPADGVMNTLDGFEDRGGGFFMDESRSKLRTDDEINTAYKALGDEQRMALDSACDSPAEGMGSDLCNKIKR